MFFEDLNTCHLTGNLTRDVEIRYSPSGTAVGNIRIGVNGRRKQGDEWVDKPNFFGVACFGKDAENAAKYLKRGRRILVEGRLDWSEWPDKEKEGQKRQGVQIIARRIIYLTSGKRTEEEQASSEPATEEQVTTETEQELAGVGAGGSEDDIDF